MCLEAAGRQSTADFSAEIGAGCCFEMSSKVHEYACGSFASSSYHFQKRCVCRCDCYEPISALKLEGVVLLSSGSELIRCNGRVEWGLGAFLGC